MGYWFITFGVLAIGSIWLYRRRKRILREWEWEADQCVDQVKNYLSETKAFES